MKRRTLVAVAGVVAAAGLAAGAAVASAGQRDPEESVSVRSTQNPHDVATYWTDERMRNAVGG
jgi:hypothetical protein